MSTVIRVHCPHCHTEADLGPDGFRLQFCDDDQTLSTYTFDCTWCGPQVKAAPDHVARLLMGAGVQTQVWDFAAELDALLGAA